MAERYLEGRAGLVTGGASGMGRAMALAIAEAGADVAIGSLLADRGDTRVGGELSNLPGKEELERTAAEIEAHGVRCLPLPLDVTSDESVEAFFRAAVDRFGKVDVLMNAAGITAEQTLSGHPDALWHKVHDVNLHGVYRTTKRCLPPMMERGWGRIVNIASTAASVGAPASPAYCASKAAVVGMSRCVALEGAPHGVTCNTISPGWVETRFGTDWLSHVGETAEGKAGEEFIRQVKAESPQGRLIHPSEIGALAAYLCREEARGITMQDLTVSGGSLW